MPQTVSDYLMEVSASCAHIPPSERLSLLRPLVAYWTRQLNAHRKGRATRFTPIEIDEILDFLDQRIMEIARD